MVTDGPNDEFDASSDDKSRAEFDNPGGRSLQRGLSDGIVIANRIIVVCLSLAFPLGLGWWLGNRWEQGIVGLLVGLLLGLIASGYQLMNMVAWLNRRAGEKSARQTAKPNTGHQPKSQSSVNESGQPHESVEEEDPWETRWREKWDDTPEEENQ